MPEKTFEMLKMPPEWELMVKLALRQPPESFPKDINWQIFESYVYKNSLPALVGAGIKKLSEATPKDNLVFAKLSSVLPMLKIRCMRQMQALAIIARDFATVGIPMLSFKGPLLAMELYGSPEFRISSDLDILVDESMLDAACKRLEALGYKEMVTPWNKTPKRRALHERHDEEMHRVYTQGDITVELHWRISYRFAEPFSGLWQRRREKKLLGQTIYIPGEIDNICYLITHAAGHGFKQLRWLLDIYELLIKSNIPISLLYLEMKTRGVAALLFETLFLLYRLPCFDMHTVSIEIMHDPNSGKRVQDMLFISQTQQNIFVRWASEISRDMKKGEKLAKAVYPQLLHTTDKEGLNERRYQHMLPTLGKRSNFILSLFEPRKADLELVDLPDSLFFLYYVIRPIHFLWRRTPFYHADNCE